MRSTRAVESALVALAASLLALGGGCRGALDAPIASAHPDDATPRRGGTLHLATFNDIRSLDPATTGDVLTASMARLVFAGLVDLDAEGRVVPDLAARVDTADGGRTYRFTLREGVRFHDGAELVAADVKRSIERALHPTTPSPTAGFYQSIDGFEAYTEKGAPHLDGVVVEGRYVVAIRLRQPDATFLPALAMSALRVTCASAGDRYSPAWAPCGAGPFRLEPGGWERGQSITFVRSDAYYRPGRPYLDAVSFELNASIVSEGFLFARGQLDATSELVQADTIRYQSDARWRPLGAYEPLRSVQGETMNTEVPPFDNVEIRRAVAAAIDREHIVQIKTTHLVALTRPVPPGLPGYDPPGDVGQRFDLPAALEHMKKAGYAYDPATGRGGWPGVVVYDLAKQSLSQFTAQSIQQDLAKIGLRIELRTSSAPTFYALTHRRGKSAMSPEGWQEDFPDPSNFLDGSFASRSIADEDTSNMSFYSNARLDDLLERARRELEPRERTRLYAEAERIVCDDAPWAFEYANRGYHVHQPYVHGYRVHPIWQEDPLDVWLDRAAPELQARADAPLTRVLLASILGGAR